MSKEMKSILSKLQNINLSSVRDFGFIFIGAVLQAISLRVFLVPSNLASVGISGLSQIINHYTGWSIGLMVIIGNIPLFLMGWRYLGGSRFALRTAFGVISFAVLIDIQLPFLPPDGVTQDLVLNALYGGLISGIGFGLVYRGRGTSGGSDILARILNHWKGISISQSYLLTDAVIMFLAGLAFSWENALYALVMLYVSGIAAEAASQGSNIVRTALIVTAQPKAVKDLILNEMGRGVTMLSGRGGFTGQDRLVLYCVITRSEIAQLKTLVREADAQAFMVVGQVHEALGEGFQPLVDG